MKMFPQRSQEGDVVMSHTQLMQGDWKAWRVPSLTCRWFFFHVPDESISNNKCAYLQPRSIDRAIMQLLNLPPELFTGVIHDLVCDVGPGKAL
jgi:hypothetical protein